MTGNHAFLHDLAVVLCVAAVTTVVFRKLGQPVVLGYLLAGLIVGPHVPIPLVADPERIDTLAELGVILVMFGIGLEFSIRRLGRALLTAGLIAVLQISTMVWLGYVIGRGLGWTGDESLFLGAMLSISSTMIIVKAFTEKGVAPRLAELVYGVLVLEDLAAVLMLALLTVLSSGRGLAPEDVIGSLGLLVAFLLAIVVGGILVVPRTMRAVVRLASPETVLVASIGLCFAMALLAQRVGYSVALGAFLAGSLVAESGRGGEIEHLVRPVRDVFAAIFFVAVGTMVDPALVVEHWAAIVLLTLAVVVGKIASVSVATFLSGYDTRTAVQAGMSMAQIGEFSFIIAGVGVGAHVIAPFLHPVIVAVCVLTTFLTPWLIRSSETVALAVDRRLPRRLQLFATLYGSWMEQLRESRRRRTTGAQVRGLLLRLALDAACIGVIIIATSVGSAWLLGLLARTHLAPALLEILLVVAAGLATAPFALGIVRCARQLGAMLGAAALPPAAASQADFGAAPRSALVVTLQLVIVLAVVLPLLAVTQPFLPSLAGLPLAALLLVLLAVAFWHRATELQQHVRAGAEVIAEALRRQVGGGDPPSLAPVSELLPGIGGPTAVRLAADSPAVGRTLGALNVRGLTGASVVAIGRGADSLLSPDGHVTLQAGDTLALAGSHEAVQAAKALLRGDPSGADAH